MIRKQPLRAVRVVLSLLYWPVGDDDTAHEMVQRFVAPAFAVH